MAGARVARTRQAFAAPIRAKTMHQQNCQERSRHQILHVRVSHVHMHQQAAACARRLIDSFPQDLSPGTKAREGKIKDILQFT